MKKETLIVIAVIGGIILLGIGYSLGLSSGKAIPEKKAEEGPKVETLLAELLKSQVIRGLVTTASGQVTGISGRDLTLSREGDTLTIFIREDAPIYRLVPPEGGTAEPAVRKEIQFEAIKAGDQVNIACQLKTDATLEGVDVTILP